MTKKALAFTPPPVRIETERLILQKHDVNLAPAMFAMIDQDRERLQIFLPWVPRIKSKQDEVQYILSTHEAWKEGTLFDYSLLLKSDQSFVGTIGAHSINHESKRCEIGYWLVGKNEGQGLMTEAVRGLEKQLFEVGFNRLEIRCDPANLSSARIPLACGYQYEGHLRENDVVNEQVRDTWVFAKLKKNYQQTFISDLTRGDFEPAFEIARLSPDQVEPHEREKLRRDLQHQPGLTVRHLDKVSAFMLYTVQHGRAQISWMAVLPDLRGQGFAQSLLEHLKVKLRDLGFSQLEVRVAGGTGGSKPRDLMRSFYLRNGFQKIQTLVNPSNPEWPEEWILSCSLA